MSAPQDITQSLLDVAQSSLAAREEIMRLRAILASIEMFTATGEGLSPEETIHIHLIAGAARDHEVPPKQAVPCAEEDEIPF